MADADIGHGVVFKRGDGASTEAFASVGEMTEISFPGMSRDAVDVTHFTSTERWKEFIGGLKDAGEITVSILFDPGDATVTAALADLNSDAAKNYQIAFADNGTTEWTFSALCTGIDGQIPLDDRMQADFTYKLSGKPGFFA